MPGRRRRNLDRAVTIAFIITMAAVVTVGVVLLRRFWDVIWANWSLSYDGTPAARAQMDANGAQARRSLVLPGTDIVFGIAGVCMFIATKRIRRLSFAAAVFAILLLELAVTGWAVS